MMDGERLAGIRELIERTLADLKLADAASEGESILVRNGHYAGRRFLFDRVQAIWFVEEQEIKFYAPDGRLLRVVRLEDRPQSRAA